MKSRILGIIEVGIVFVLMSVLFRSIQSIPLSTKINASLEGFLFSEYATLLVVVAIIYIARCRSISNGSISEKLEYQTKIIVRGFLPIFTLSVLLNWIDWRQWIGAILISVIEIGLLFWFAWLVRHQQPVWQKVSIGSSLLLLPSMMQISAKLVSVLVAIIYFYLFVALSEEILFRGYIQTRLNRAFGRTKRFFGIQWGWGLIVTAVLFGFWHLGWGTDTLNWTQVLWTMFAGLIFGIVREKSESVLAPTILHGSMNYGPQAILFYLFWS